MNAQPQAAEALAKDPATDDTALVRRVLAGDLAAFELVMRRHNRRLYRLARATLRDDAEAEDALQEAYVQAWRSLAQFRGDAALATWLARVVMNECRARLRRGARRQNVIPMAADGGDAIDEAADLDGLRPEEAAMRSELRALIERHVDALPDALRTVFVLRGVEEMSVEDVAACLDLPAATVRSRHFRARALLREALARDIDVSERDAFAFDGARCDRIVAAVLARIGAG
jgi:RNA polymerase sigma-70 factor (ECF subfamily)